MSSLESLIDDQLLDELKKELVKTLNKLPHPINNRIKEYIIGNTGKMLRPLLVMVSAKLLGADEKGMQIANTCGVMIESLHNMTLIHDDIVDGAPKRRGNPSYHKLHGKDRALHDGDVLHAYALTLLDEWKPLKLILDISYEVGKGNAFELEDRLDNVFDFDSERIIDVMRLKTAIVFCGCIELACMAAKRDELAIKLRDSVLNGGIAFQIQDDILDILGSTESFGKESYWDIQESKRNLFLFYALKTEHKEKIMEIYSKAVGKKTTEEVEFIVSVFRDVKDAVIEQRDRFLEISVNSLESLREELENPKDIELLKFLEELILYLGSRQK